MYEVSLREKAVYAVAENGVVRVRCVEGHLWVSMAGDDRDYILRAGQSIEADAACQPVVQALTAAARFEVSQLLASAPNQSVPRGFVIATCG